MTFLLETQLKKQLILLRRRGDWCTVTSARQTKYGTRIDYIFAHAELVQKEFIDCEIRADFEGSDHCPVVATLRASLQAALKPPALCTKYMPEFAGK